MQIQNFMDKQEVIKTINMLVSDKFTIKLKKENETLIGVFNNIDVCVNKMFDLQDTDIKEITINTNKVKNEITNEFSKFEIENAKINYLVLNVCYKNLKEDFATNAQLKETKNVANKIFKYMKEQGFNTPYFAEHEKGVDLLYKVDVDYSKINEKILNDMVAKINKLFENEFVEVCNTNEIGECELYGSDYNLDFDTMFIGAKNSFLKESKAIETNDIKLILNILKTKENIEIIEEVKKPNNLQKEIKPLDMSNMNKFLTTNEILTMPRFEGEFIKTGITLLDKKLRGLKKGTVTVLSGLRAAGKSSVISGIVLEATQQNYRTALFSGELTAHSLLNWMMLQAAGKTNTIPTQYENYYKVKDEVIKPISNWLNEQVYIYNNDYGNNFKIIVEALEYCIVNNKIDLIILDNMMALNLAESGSDKYEQQSLFVQKLQWLAKKYNVHVLFVAHPRKSVGFLRLEDISGTNDIVNLVDNGIILHRVNKDFKDLSKAKFKWEDENEIYNCSNVIEICKDREGGVCDEFIPLFYEPESKRLKNSFGEQKIYNWDEKRNWTNAEVSGILEPTNN